MQEVEARGCCGVLSGPCRTGAELKTDASSSQSLHKHDPFVIFQYVW